MTRTRKLYLIWLAFSVILHALLLVSLPRFRVPQTVPSVVELMDVPSMVATPKHVAHAANGARDFRARQAAHAGVPSTLRGDLELAPSFEPRARDELAADFAPKFDSDGVPMDDPTSPWGSGGAEFARVRDLAKFDKLYDLIDANVMYPSVLAYHQIQGTVNARLVLAQDGRCDWHHSHITSTSRHLKVYVLDVLNKVCKRNLKSFARKESSANLDLSFKFAITEHNEETLIEAEKKVVGNVFLFYRNSQQSVAEWHLGPFRGMFPVPFASIDFSWLQENYDSVVHSRDPLRDFKEHLVDSLADERPDS